jgi:hypothetical protein
MVGYRHNNGGYRLLVITKNQPNILVDTPQVTQITHTQCSHVSSGHTSSNTNHTYTVCTCLVDTPQVTQITHTQCARV